MAWFLSRDCTETGRILLTGGGRLSSVIFAETGEIFDPTLRAEDVGARIGQVLDESTLYPVHNQAEAGARYFRHMPWTAGAAPDFGPDVERG